MFLQLPRSSEHSIFSVNLNNYVDGVTPKGQDVRFETNLLGSTNKQFRVPFQKLDLAMTRRHS